MSNRMSGLLVTQKRDSWDRNGIRGRGDGAAGIAAGKGDGLDGFARGDADRARVLCG